MRILFLVSLFFLQSGFADDVSPSDFFSRISGEYKVSKAGGEKPHDGTDVGLVMVDGNDGIISFSFCQPESGICDPNDQYFALNKVQITRTVFSDLASSYELVLKEGDKTLRYSWDENGSLISFKNYQYVLANGNVVTLEHEFEKKKEILEQRIEPLTFFNEMKGVYPVFAIQGEAPHNPTIGVIDIYEGEGNLSFSYCSEATGCMPNDEYFPLDRTEVKLTQTDASKKYDLLLKEGEKVKKFTWEIKDGVYTLTNYQFEVLGKVITLEHKATRQ